jgi:serine/threonine protein kinase
MLGSSLQIPMVSIRRFFHFVARPLTGRGFSHHGIVGQTLKGRYKILHKLSAGGLGQTFIAEDLDMPEPRPRRVVKQILAEKMNAATQRYFQKEAQALFRLSHPQIPVLQASFEVEGIPYIVQDFIEGHDLAAEIGHYGDVEAVDRARCWTEQDVIIFLMDMLGILDYIHTQKIIHRDIKPSNIMRRRSDDVLVLIDFGIVKNTDNSGGSSRSIPFGTQGYMPLEQGLSNAQFNSDVYALGMTAIQAIIGIPPYYLSIEQRLSLLGQAVSSALFKVISYMVDENYHKRCQSAQEALSLLQPLSVGDLSDYRSPSRFASRSSKPTSPLEPDAPQPKKLPQKLSLVAHGVKGISPYLILAGILITTIIAGIIYFTTPIALDRSEENIDRLKKDSDIQQTLSDFTKKIVLNPQDPSTYFRRGYLRQHKLNDPEGALADYNKVIELDPNNSKAYKNRGKLKENKLNDSQGALADYSKAIKINSLYSEAYHYRSSLKYYSLDDFQGALADCNKAIEINPKLASYYITRANMKSGKLKDFQGALADYDKAIELDFKDVHAYRLRANLKARDLKDFQGALADYNKAVDLDPKDTRTYEMFGDIKAEYLSDTLGAMHEYNKMIEIDPRNTSAYLSLGQLKYSKLNDFQGALADYNKAIKIDPRDGSSYYRRANLKSRHLNDIQGALADYDKALQLDPKNLYGYFDRGVHKRDKLKNTQGAISDFRTVIQVYWQRKQSESFYFYGEGIMKEPLFELKELGASE